jgi:hypothetical protein
MGRAIGRLIITGGLVDFYGFSDFGRNCQGNGVALPQVSETVMDFSATLTYNSLDTLPGRHNLIFPGSYAGKDTVILLYEPRVSNSIEISAWVNISLPERTIFYTGWIDFR